MRMKKRANMLINSIIVSIVILCCARHVSSWQQMLEPFRLPSVNLQQSTFQLPVKNLNSNPIASVASPLILETTRPPQDDVLERQQLQQQQQQQQQVDQVQTQTVPAPTSTAGKILSSLVSNSIEVATAALKDAATNSNASTKLDANNSDSNNSVSNKPTTVAANIMSSMMKTRKGSSSSSHDSATKDIEQQIIQQHARVHQYLTPGRKFSGSSSSSHTSSSFGESDGRDSSALSSIFDNFKSGITSRSSIVKAISDNKLARTLTDVGKTLGSNKYVAGAAAASAIAALGLAVSKFMTPYMYANSGFSGSEPLMSSGSSDSYTNLNPNRLSSGDFLSVSSSPAQDISTFMTSYNPQPMIQQQFGNYQEQQQQQTRPSSYLDTAATTYQTGVYMQSPTTSSNGKPENFFITYKQAPQSASSSASESINQRQQQSIQSDVNGHYTGYYGNQPDFNNQYTQLVGTVNSEINSNSNYNDQQQPQSTRPEYYYNSQQQQQQQQQSQSQDLMSSGDQMLPSASYEEPSYLPSNQRHHPTNQLRPTIVRTPQNYLPSSSSRPVVQSNQRRFGPVSLRLKDSDKVRIVKAKEVQFATWPTSYMKGENYPHAGDKSSASPSVIGTESHSDRSGKSSNGLQQTQQTNSMILSTSNLGKNQGQATLQANRGNNNIAAHRIIKPSSSMGQQTQTAPAPTTTTTTISTMTTAVTSDKPEAERRRSSSSSSSSSSPWISIIQQQQPQQQVRQQNSIDHQEISSLSTSLNQAAESNGQQERTFTMKGLDYDSQPQQQADTSNERGLITAPTTSETTYNMRQLSGDISTSGKQQQTGDNNGSNNNNVIKTIEVNTKSGIKLAGQQQLKPLRQQQQQQVESSSSTPMGGIDGMLFSGRPMKLRQSHSGQVSSDQQTATEESSGSNNNNNNNNNEDSNEQTTQRRGQSADSSTQGKSSDNPEDPSSSSSSSAS